MEPEAIVPCNFPNRPTVEAHPHERIISALNALMFTMFRIHLALTPAINTCHDNSPNVRTATITRESKDYRTDGPVVKTIWLAVRTGGRETR